MAEESSLSNFDSISDDVLLHILSFVPRRDWKYISAVCSRFRNVCHDKEIFRVSDLSCAYGWSENHFTDFIRAGCSYLETLNLNHCYWLSSSVISTYVSRCKKIKHLFLLDCKLTTKGLSKIICSMECLKSLVVSVSNLLEFSNMINGDQAVQLALQNLQHFGLHIREESNGSVPNSLQFHLSQQTTIIEYCPNLESFCVIGMPGLCKKLSKRLIHPLIVKTENLTKMKTMTINCTNDATSRLYFFGVQVKAFEQPKILFRNLSVSGLDLLKQAVKRSFFIRALKDSSPTLVNLDLSRVHLDQLEASVIIDSAPCLKYLNLSDIRLESSCLGLLAMASRCTNLVSLNLKGLTSGRKPWAQEELDGLSQILGNCRQLKHLNLAGIHMCGKTPSSVQDKSLLDVLTEHDISALESLAMSVCCMIRKKSPVERKSEGIVFKGFGKRQRIARNLQPEPSTSSGNDKHDIEGDNTELSCLQRACPRLISFELINPSFRESVIVSNPNSLYINPCETSHKFCGKYLREISQWTNLKYLQLTGLPAVCNSSGFKEIAEKCVHLESLYIAYIYIGTFLKQVTDVLQYFKQLKDLRIEQPWLKLDERFYELCLGCKNLQRLVIASRNCRPDVKLLDNYIQKASKLYVIQVFSDMFLKDCDRYQSILQKRYEVLRPGFQVVLEQLQHDRVPFVLATLPLVHLDEITLLSSKVCSKPLYSSCGE